MIPVLNTRPKIAAPETSNTRPGVSADVSPDTPPDTLSAALAAAGFDPIDVPLVELVLLQDALSLLDRLSDRHYDGILLSSPNLLPLLQSLGRTVPAAWRTKPWYLIGERARPDVEALGARVAFVPRGEASLEGFLAEIPVQDNLRLIHPGSTKTRLEPSLFTGKGIDLHNMALYEPRCPDGAAAALEAAWPRLTPRGAVLFASSSAVHHLFAAAPALARTLVADDGPVPVSIGSSTTRTLRMYHVARSHQTPTADTAGFLETLNHIFPKESRS